MFRTPYHVYTKEPPPIIDQSDEGMFSEIRAMITNNETVNIDMLAIISAELTLWRVPLIVIQML